MSKTLINGIAFTSMPMRAQMLYYQMQNVADEDGYLTDEQFPANPKGKTIDLLLERKFVLKVDNGFALITSEHVRNYLSMGGEEEVKKVDANTIETPVNEDKNATYIGAKEWFSYIYKNYPCSLSKNKKVGLNLYYSWLIGKKITVMGKRKTVKYNHIQIQAAFDCFCDDKIGTEEMYIPRLQTFLGENILCNYVVQSKEQYKKLAESLYGENWQSLKFIYTEE